MLELIYVSSPPLISATFVKPAGAMSCASRFQRGRLTEHDVDVLVTGIGLADLRRLATRERAQTIIANCVHPSCREPLAAITGVPGRAAATRRSCRKSRFPGTPSCAGGEQCRHNRPPLWKLVATVCKSGVPDDPVEWKR